VREEDSRLRILLVNWQDRTNPLAGGAEIHLHEIFGRIARRHDVTLLVSGWKGAAPRDMLDGMEVIRVGTRYTFPLHARRAYKQSGLAESVDLIVEDINKVPLFTPVWGGVPVAGIVPHLFGTTAFQQESWPIASVVWAAERLMPSVYRDSRFLVISESTAEDLVDRGFERDRITVSYPGVDHGTFIPAHGLGRFEIPTALYVGRLRRYKSLDVVIRALGLLARSDRPYRFLVAGTGDDRPRLEALAASEGVADRVSFLGWIPEEEKVDLLRRSWVNVYPSPKEGWGITNIEAAACGTPSVASDSPGLRESVVDGVTGYLAAHGDAAGWASHLRAIGTDAALRDRLGENGVEHAAGLTWERTARETEDFMLQALHTAV
jgi:glycosyltransferase involved in cell wall biosynthesis